MKPIDDGLLLSIEDGLHATARDLARALPDDGIPPLPPSRQPGRPVARPSLGQRICQLFAPLTAATAVVAAVAGPPAIVHGMALVATAHPHESQAHASGIPSYYVLVRKKGPGIRHGGDALITSTASGRTLAVVCAPRPYAFVLVTGGAASDRTFVLDGQDQADGVPRLFLLTFAFRRNGQITKTVKPLKAGFTLGSLLALSPDGERLALAQSPGTQLMVVTLATGASQTWATDNSWWYALSWHSDGRAVHYCRRAYSSQIYHCGALNISAGTRGPLAQSSCSPSALASALSARHKTARCSSTGSTGPLPNSPCIHSSSSKTSAVSPRPIPSCGEPPMYWQLPGNFSSASSIAW